MNLPIDPVLPDLVRALRDHGATVLSAATGSGKTTRVPEALLDDRGTTLVVQPRRVAARAAAAFVARQRGQPVGEDVGHAVRFDTRGGAHTRLWFVTPGVLLRRLIDDPFLDGVATVVLDEVHERSLDLDLCLALLVHVRRAVRDDLRLLAMSATADTAALAALLGGAPVVRAPGRAFPVDVTYVPRPDDRPLPQRVAHGVRAMLDTTAGDVLAFLPGAPEIRATEDALRGLPGVDVVALHGRLPPGQQDAALTPGPRRRVVLATNVAETSVTIPGVTGVVDSGLVRRLRHDPSAGLDHLVTEDTSRASADQRAGRAGRLAPGHCLRLWTEASHARRAAFDPPELQRVDLAGAVLAIRAFGEPNPAALPWPDAPAPGRLAAATDLLRRLGALGPDGGLTADGRAMAAIPAPPRAARALLDGARAGHTEAVALAVALLTEPDALRRDSPARAVSPSDLDDQRDALDRPDTQGWSPAAPGAAGRLRDVARQLARAVRHVRPVRTPDDAVARALLAGWPDRVARRRGDSDALHLVTGRGATLHPHSAVRHAPWLLALDMTDDRVRRAVAIDPAWLDATDAVEVTWDADADRVRGERVRRVGAIVLDRQATPDVPRDAVHAALVAAAATVAPTRWLSDDPGWTRLRARVAFVRRHRPDVALPDVSDDALRHAIPAVAPAARRLADVARADWSGWLRGSLPWDAARELDRLAPERITVPSGQAIALDYPDDGPPVLAVRIQAMFGATSTPQVAGMPVLLHLLAPNGRPQQVTDDLDGFWDRAWPEVRRDLRGRYPKHAWPEDPRAAPPQARPGRR